METPHANQGRILEAEEATTTEEAPAQDNGRLHDLKDVILECQRLEIDAYVVGRWVWASFSDRPPVATRDALKTMGFIWNKNRQAWMHNCGYRTKQAKGYDPRDKYGTIPVEQFNREELEATL